MKLTSWRTVLSWTYLARLLVLICGLFVFALGIILTYRSGLGLDPWDVFHQGISRHTPFSFGTASIVVGAAILGIGLLLKVYPGVGTVLNILLIGVFIDVLLWLNLVPDLSGSPVIVLLLVDAAGVALIGLGTALYISPHLGAGPRDGLMMRLHTLTKLRIAIVRTSIEVSVLLIGFFLGGTVGIGTLIFALGVGPAVEASFYLLKKITAFLHLPVQPAGKMVLDANKTETH